MSIELTKKQLEGLDIAVQRYNEGHRWTCIAGYAGTGKSTLIKFIISALGVNPDTDVCYVAFTGKAATVLKQKGCPNTMTAHKLLYKAKPMPNGTYKFIPKTVLEHPYKVIVVDEVSMLPKPMWELLTSHGAYILATGDPGQLPPIDKDSDNHVLNNAHVFLDEVMRQAQDSEIIRLSMWIREGKPLDQFPCKNEQVQIITRGQVVTGMYEWADQILCATNNMRNDINNAFRKQKGYGFEPEVGDKIISLRNHWEFFSLTGDWALTNGTIGTIANFHKEIRYCPPWISKDPLIYMYTDMILEEEDSFHYIPVDFKALVDGKPALDSRQAYQLAKTKKMEPPYDFAYAYAITCHKAQGSEWGKVLIFEEGFPFETEEHKRWLYTAVTRAAEKVVIVRK